MILSRPCASLTDRDIAARNALVAKCTFESLGEEQRQKVDQQVLDLLILQGISASRALRYRPLLRETQYYGMAAIAMAFLGIPPALPGILRRERWERVQNPLVALTGADVEIRRVANEILRKYWIQVSISDEHRQRFKWHRLLPENRKQKDWN